MFSMNFMYNHVDFIVKFNLDTLKKPSLYYIKQMLCILTSEWNFYYNILWLT